MDMQVFFEVVAPLLEIDVAALLCISTTLDSGNFYSKLVNMKNPDTGENMFKILWYKNVPCDKCKEGPNPAQCTHNLMDLPPWQSADKHKKIKAMMKEHEDLMQRETMCEITESNDPAFKEAHIDWIENNPRAIPHGSVSHVFVGIDPNGGGDSKFAIHSFYKDHHSRFVVCGLESVNTRDTDEQKQILRDHLIKLRQQDAFRHAKFVIIPESNLGLEAGHINANMRELNWTNLCVMHEDVGGAPGVRTTHLAKEAMVIHAQDLMREKRLFFAQNIVTVDRKRTAEENVQELIFQLRGFMIITEPSKTAFGKVKKTYSGKLSGGDDQVMAAMIAWLNERVFFRSTKYAAFNQVATR